MFLEFVLWIVILMRVFSFYYEEKNQFQNNDDKLLETHLLCLILIPIQINMN